MELIEDILSDINLDIKKLEKYSDNKILRNILEYAFIPEKKFLLPDGVPPYKEQSGPSVQLTGALAMEAKKFYVYLRADLKPAKREQLFISCLEYVSKKEAGILLAIKDQNLPALYPNITFDALKSYGYFN